MSATDGDSRAWTLFDRAAEADGIEGILIQGIGGVFLGLFTAIASGILAIGDLVIQPVSALADAGAQIVNVLFGDTILAVIAAGADETIRSLTGGFSLGPLTLPAAVGVLLLTWWIVGRYRQEDETGNLIPGLPFDIPFVGQEEEGDEAG